jgi:hypothetical protein
MDGEMKMWAVMKGKRMVEPAFHDEQLARDVCAAYGIGYDVRIVTVGDAP